MDLWISSNIKVGKIDHFWDIRFLPDFDPKMPFLAPISRNLGLNIESDVKNGFLDPKNIFLDILHEHFCDLSMKIWFLFFFTEKSKMAAVGHLEFKVPIIFRLGGYPSSNPYTIGHLYWKNGAFITFCPIVMLSTPTIILILVNTPVLFLLIPSFYF